MPFSQASSTSLEFGVSFFRSPSFSAPPVGALRDNLIEQAVLADQLGLDVFGFSEDFAVDMLGMDLADLLHQLAEATSDITLAASISDIERTDLNTRNAQRNDLQQITGNRIEVVINRDQERAAVESTKSKFNHHLAAWNDLTGSSPHHATWIEVAGRSDAILQAAQYNCPLLLRVNSGSPLDWKPFVDMYHAAISRFGQESLPLGLLVPGFVSNTEQELDSQPFGPIDHDAGFFGSPASVAEKIATVVEHLGLSRIILRYNCGSCNHESAMECLRLFAAEVVPQVREALAAR
ncbi:hypothetical protein [Corynebacterium hindlerae]|uniref:hypothetical protein n=1 Tax=Corynebacterium hindlerae TaxID=699041 RepID=UPI0031B674AD